MQFHLVALPCDYPQSARVDESLIKLAANNGPVASIWQAEQGLVVPRSYQRYERFDEVCDSFAKQSWPVTVRLSGGGLVPQGPGIINLSLAYAVQGLPLDHSTAAYEHICGVIQSALKKLDIHTHPQPVHGSFCDGRYNLAWGPADAAKKVVGTAQLWRRVRPEHLDDTAVNKQLRPEQPIIASTSFSSPASQVQIVLVHALILAAIDVAKVTDRINQFERELDSGKRYDPDCVASLVKCRDALPAYSDDEFMQALKNALTDELT